MPEIFDTHIDGMPDDIVSWSQRIGGRSEARIVLQGLQIGQTVVYGSDEPAHAHRVDGSGKTVCSVQEIIGRINRRTLTKRLKSQHNDEGKIFITCLVRGVYRGN
jgi:hypothetical protein